MVNLFLASMAFAARSEESRIDEVSVQAKVPSVAQGQGQGQGKTKKAGTPVEKLGPLQSLMAVADEGFLTIRKSFLRQDMDGRFYSSFIQLAGTNDAMICVPAKADKSPYFSATIYRGKSDADADLAYEAYEKTIDHEVKQPWSKFICETHEPVRTLQWLNLESVPQGGSIVLIKKVQGIEILVCIVVEQAH